MKLGIKLINLTAVAGERSLAYELYLQPYQTYEDDGDEKTQDSRASHTRHDPSTNRNIRCVNIGASFTNVNKLCFINWGNNNKCLCCVKVVCIDKLPIKRFIMNFPIYYEYYTFRDLNLRFVSLPAFHRTTVFYYLIFYTFLDILLIY